MSLNKHLEGHYLHGFLLNAIEDKLPQLGLSKNNVSIEDLAPVDEFHIGSRIATKHLTDQLHLSKTGTVLDVGCGLGGAARFVAQEYECEVLGVDLSNEYIETGNELNSWVKLNHKIKLFTGDVAEMDFKPNSFQAAFMLHVGMNIVDKKHVFKKIYSMVKEDGVFGIYDIMRDKSGGMVYPCPWASDESMSFLETENQYSEALKQAGFSIISTNDRRQFALDFFEALMEKSKAAGGPPPLGLHTLMKDQTPLKIGNMIENIKNGFIKPVEIIAKK